MTTHPTGIEGERVSTREIFWYFLKLGWLAFGGPIGQIGLMHLEVVERRKWISEDEFLRALNFCHVLPGPEALFQAEAADLLSKFPPPRTPAAPGGGRKPLRTST